MSSVFEVGGLLVSTSMLAFVLFFLMSPWAVGRLAKVGKGDAAMLGRIAERSILLGVIVARVAFIAEYPDAYRANPVSALFLWQSGFVLWAGVVAGITYIGWRLAHAKLPARDGAIMAGGMLPPFFAYVLVISTLGMFTSAEQLRPGASAPPLQLVDMQEHPRTLSGLRGRPVILNFWATWCYACRREMPLLNETYAKWKSRGLRVVGVDLAEPVDQIEQFLAATPVSYDIWKDQVRSGTTQGPSETQRYYGLTGSVGLPTTVFIDAQGIVRSVKIGELTPAVLATELPAIGLR